MTPKLLVANRGEIAIRILRSASELGWDTVAIYTENDTSHATYADEAIELENISDFVDVDTIVKIAYSMNCTHLHPGYGFLAESPNLPLALLQQKPTGKRVEFIGPSSNALRIASDKMLSRELATSLNISVAPGQRVSSADEIRSFSQISGQRQAHSAIGYPVMIKALDGGGGRGIRVVYSEGEVDEAFKRCLGESPSKQLFVEKALTGPGWKHIEIQVIGDGVTINHFWERECSVQRRFQKIVEIAPSRLPRSAIRPLINASLKMAKTMQYKGLGTFEFLVNVQSPTYEWVFLEINPRVQVEHTITEEINNIDLVRAQLLLFAPSALSSSSTLASLSMDDPPPIPTSYAIQLRLNAEDPLKGFQLSPGTLHMTDVVWPTGKGVRVDTWLSAGPSENPHESQWTVGTDFDSLLAKIIVKGATFEETTQRGILALRELRLGDTGTGRGGSKVLETNAAVLAGTLKHPDWLGTHGEVDTLWLERNLKNVITLGQDLLKPKRVPGLQVSPAAEDVSSRTAVEAAPIGGTGNILLQPGTLFHLTMSPPDQISVGGSETNTTVKHALTITSVERNAFPVELSGTFLSSLPSPFSLITSSSGDPAITPISFTLTQSTSASASGDGKQFELADPNDPGHISSPMTGKVVELHPALMQASTTVSESSAPKIPSKIHVRSGQALLVLSVMKMENAITAPWDGYVQRVGRGVKVGVVLGESMLVCVLERGSDMGKLPGHDTSGKARL